MSEREWQDVMWSCERWLSNRRPTDAADLLRAAADALAPGTRPDRYGEGDVVTSFESRMAEILGQEAAALMPSGTMAQQIALRIHCRRRGLDTVAFHPTCHLELHEHAAYAHLHGLKAELVGSRDRLIELSDLESLHTPLAALLLELPQREIGGRLPSWDELTGQIAWARERGIATHLDGARIWESAPFYDRSPAEIAGLFDTVYVSLYKGVGAVAGSILAGTRECIDDARVWRRRHGGTLPSLFPFAASALPGLERALPQMPRFLDHARSVAAALGELPGVSVVPTVPHTPLFHLHLRGQREVLLSRALDVASASGVWLFHRLGDTVLPGHSKLEVNIGEPALAIAPAEAAELFARVLGV